MMPSMPAKTGQGYSNSATFAATFYFGYLEVLIVHRTPLFSAVLPLTFFFFKSVLGATVCEMLSGVAFFHATLPNSLLV